jgi:muramoyltetrapeptide carboxypeptidase
MNSKKIALIAPSKGTTKEKLGLALGRLDGMGFPDVICRSNILDRDLDYWSGLVKERAKEINEYFLSDSVDIIWAMSGGYGSLEVLPELNYSEIKGRGKFFVGYSDITSLSIALLQKADVKSVQFHMPGSRDWVVSDLEVDLFKAVLDGKGYQISLDDRQVVFEGAAEAELVGGCLSVICKTLGTEYEIDTDGKILYLEDVAEVGPRFYAYLCQLELAGKFDNVKGVVFAKVRDSDDYLPFLERFCERLREKNIPVVKEFLSGHNEVKVPIVIGGRYCLNTSEKVLEYRAN